MKIKSLLRKVPYLNKKISLMKPNVRDILLHFFSPDEKITFLDIGANSGQTIEFINGIFRKAQIYSFEPTPHLYAGLLEKYAGFENVHTFELALADKDQPIDLYESEFSPTNSCLEPNIPLHNDFNEWLTKALEQSTRIIVKGLTLDSWQKSNLDDQVIDVVKIDTQGFEYNVIKGGINTLKDAVKIVYFETHYHDFYKEAKPFYKIFELLDKNDFYYYCQVVSEKRNNYQALESDVFFVNRNFIKPFE